MDLYFQILARLQLNESKILQKISFGKMNRWISISKFVHLCLDYWVHS
jgi:hypothetical protein